MFSTIEDIYIGVIDTEKGVKEKVHFFDTAGLVGITTGCNSTFHMVSHLLIYLKKNEHL
jgi:preprotein translocase subunit SecF